MEVEVKSRPGAKRLFCTLKEALELTGGIPAGLLPSYNGAKPVLRALEAWEVSAVNPDTSGNTEAWAVEFDENVRRQDGSGSDLVHRILAPCGVLLQKMQEFPGLPWKYYPESGELRRGNAM